MYILECDLNYLPQLNFSSLIIGLTMFGSDHKWNIANN